MKEYYVKFNFSYFYKVVVDNKNVSLYLIDTSVELDRNREYPKIHSFIIKDYMISKNHCKYSGEEQDEDTNTYGILFRINELKYIYVGDRIYSFSAYNVIEEFYSPIGNNNVPYSYAIDRDKNHYLMLERVILYNQTIQEDPYKKYYKESIMVNHSKNIKYKDIVRCFINGIEYDLTYDPFPKEKYNFWLSCPELCDGNLILHYETENSNHEIMPKSMYIKINNKFGRKRNYVPFMDNKFL